MEIHQLEIFLAVMESPSMARAAAKVCLSAGAVSLQLHALAGELNAELFVRRGRRLLPTPAALRLAEQAKTLVNVSHQIKQEFESDLTRDTHLRPFHIFYMEPPTGVSKEKTNFVIEPHSTKEKLRVRYGSAAGTD
jgi:DNA-binding transcriptional LysR family regulator